MNEVNIQKNPRSTFLKNAAASDFGPEMVAEKSAMLGAWRASIVETVRAAIRTRFEHVASRLAVRADVA